MFCPTCGKDNSLELKYCASCGTNLESVSQALMGGEKDFFTKMDSGIDYLFSRYSEHVFKNTPNALSGRRVSASWRLLGQAVLTSLIDIFLFFLMWNVMPLRLLILVISTPFRLLAERTPEDQRGSLPNTGYKPPALAEGIHEIWRGDSVPSVTENTTTHFEGVSGTSSQAAPTTDRLKR